MQRIRLLIDTTMDDADIAELAERIAEQEVVMIQFTGLGSPAGGRLMGAQQVAVDAT
jgi:hypothetical protein